MNENHEAKCEELAKQIMKLPSRQRSAFLWVVKNIDAVSKMCASMALTEEDREEIKAKANETDDVVIPLLVELESYIHSDAFN